MGVRDRDLPQPTDRESLCTCGQAAASVHMSSDSRLLHCVKDRWVSVVALSAR